MQDIHSLRGLNRPLTKFEKACFASALEEHMKVEYTPRKDGNSDG